MLPSSGAAICERDRTEHGIAGGLESDRLGAMIEGESAEFLGPMRAKQSLSLGQCVQLGAKIVGWAMMPPAWIVLEGDNLGLDEGVDLVLERLLLGSEAEIHDEPFLSFSFLASSALTHALSSPRGPPQRERQSRRIAYRHWP